MRRYRMMKYIQMAESQMPESQISEPWRTKSKSDIWTADDLILTISHFQALHPDDVSEILMERSGQIPTSCSYSTVIEELEYFSALNPVEIESIMEELRNN